VDAPLDAATDRRVQDEGMPIQNDHPALRRAVARGVRKIRAERGLSQEGLARAAQCSYSLLRRVETASVDASLTMIDRIAAALGASGVEFIQRGAEAGGEVA
jgi:ribosome-binding protein aMBF1 (putative translation factor)